MKTNKMKKRILGLVVCIAVLVMQVMPVMASPDDIGGTANVLDYAVTTVVTPTSLKIALNPNGYDITTKYVKTTDEAVDEDKTYFTVAGGVYSAVEDPSDDDIDTYYEAVISNAQIISLNYGMANKSTAAQTVKVDIKATYTSTDNKEAIEFVDEAAKAQAYNETSNPTGAAKNELKMYLAVASAATADSGESVTAATYKKSTAYDADTTYYTKSAGVYTISSINNFGNTDRVLSQLNIAKYCNIPFYLLPQSFGPLDFPEEKLSLMKELLSYARIIYARENDGKLLLEHKLGLKNVVLSNDI